MAHFRVSSSNVIHEIIDGEVVLINLQTGSYYSVDSVGAVVWDGIGKGLSLSQIVDTVSSRYSGSPMEIERGVQQLVDQLQEEQLIVPDEHSDEQRQKETLAAGSNGERDRPFEAPLLHKYTDMEDLLLLDPIHDVDESGWPNKAKTE